MPLLQRLSIKAKLTCSFGLMLLLLAAMGGMSLHGLSRMDEVSSRIADSRLPALREAGGLRAALNEARVSVLYLLLVKDAPALEEQARRVERQATGFDTAIRDFRRHITTPAGQQMVDELARHWAAYKSGAARVAELVREGRLAEAEALNQQAVRQAAEGAAGVIDWLIETAGQQADAARRQGAETTATLGSLTLGVLALAVVLAIGLGVLMVRGIGQGIAAILRPMEALAAGRLEAEVPDLGRGTELGAIATAVRSFKESLIEADRLRAAQEADRRGKEQRALALAELVRGFEARVGEMVGILSSASTELEATARDMSGTAEQTNGQASQVATAAGEASGGVQTVAAATEQLTSAIQEISRQVAQATGVARQAVENAQRTDTTVSTLAEGAGRIGDVVGLISDIAGQTNLLALNATIEAARAGEAGKGFAVVASEVKSLAAQTAKATEEIGGQIGQIQQATQEAVGEIRRIVSTINEMSQITVAIAAAVEEQSAATSEIARTVQQTAQATTAVGQSIGLVSQGASNTGAAASQVLAAASELSRQSERLNGEVRDFTTRVRAA
ncbi:methyl-accepting chemotaxis protein [Teichococcus aerofrigidensis]